VRCNWLQPDGEPGRLAAHDPVRRGCDQSQRTRIRWNEVRWDKVRWGEMRRVIWTLL